MGAWLVLTPKGIFTQRRALLAHEDTFESTRQERGHGNDLANLAVFDRGIAIIAVEERNAAPKHHDRQHEHFGRGGSTEIIAQIGIEPSALQPGEDGRRSFARFRQCTRQISATPTARTLSRLAARTPSIMAGRQIAVNRERAPNSRRTVWQTAKKIPERFVAAVTTLFELDLGVGRV